jgi:hypothetical protein
LLPSGKISQQKRQKRKLDGIFIIFESNPKIKSILTMVLVSHPRCYILATQQKVTTLVTLLSSQV